MVDALDSGRQSRVFRFLDGTELINARTPIRSPIISLKYASLRNIELAGKQLLKSTDLTQGWLSRAELAKTNLEGTDLSNANLCRADHSDANLKDAKLSGVYLPHTDLSHWTPIATCCPV